MAGKVDYVTLNTTADVLIISLSSHVVLPNGPRCTLDIASPKTKAKSFFVFVF